MSDHPAIVENDQRTLTLAAWLSIALVSDLPDIFCTLVLGQIPDWMFLAKTTILALFLGLCFAWGKLRPLRPYAIILLVFYAALTISDWVSAMPWWRGLVSDPAPSFLHWYLRPVLRDIGVTLIVLVALWVVKRRRSEFFLVKGQLDAPIEPVRWLGIRPGESWRAFGWIFACAAGIAVAIPSLLAVQPTPGIWMKVIPLIPVAMLFAAINAFNEELYFRSTLLSTLPKVIGKNQALLLASVFFGLSHYLYGSPPGVVGFLMTGFLAWLIGKSMLETKGFVWPWFIHFVPDVVIFISYAMSWLQSP